MGVPVLNKPVQGYDKYIIYSDGRIFSLYTNRFLVPHKAKNGYLYVALRGTTNKYIPVHRLVAAHFVSGYKNDMCVNHKDEDKTNNKASNLEWVTKAYNNTYNGKAQRCCKQIAQYDTEGTLLKQWTSARAASTELGIQYKNISAVCRYKRKSAGGYVWRFA